ncbi:MAG: FixH family protein [Arenicellales bacterium]
MAGTDSKNLWYKQPMVWMVIGIPLTSVILGIGMIVLAFHDWDGLVVDDYYKEGLAINQTLERDAHAAALGLTAKVRFEAATGRVSLSLSGSPSFQSPAVLKLGFYHATRQGLDRVLSLRRDANGVYSATMPALPYGRWYVSAETPQWRLIKEVMLPGKNGFVITTRSQARAAPASVGSGT